MKEPQAVLDMIASIRQKRAEQEVLFKQLEQMAHIALRGVDLDNLESLTFSSNDITYEQTRALRREHRIPPVPGRNGDNYLFDWLAARYFNVANMKNGETIVLFPMVSKV